MRKRHLWLQAALLAGIMASVSPASALAESAQEETEPGTETAVYDSEITLDAEDAEPELKVEDLKDTDLNTYWPIEGDDQYITLGELEGLELTRTHYTISDGDIDNELSDRMYSYSYLEDADTASFGDVVTMDLVTTVNGEETIDNEYTLDVGYEEISAQMDEYLDGCKVGDVIEFSEAFDEDTAAYEDWVDQTVDFKATITAVQTTAVPEPTDEWVKENTEYENLEAYKKAVGEELQASYDSQSENDLAQAAINAAMDACTFNGYPQDLYDEAYEAAEAQYMYIAEMWGMELDDLYEAYGMSEDDLAESSEDMARYRLLLSAYGKANDLSVTYDDFAAFLDGVYESYGYTSADEMLSDYGAEEISLAVIEKKISDQLLATAKITVEEYDAEDESLLDEYESEWDDWTDEDESELYEIAGIGDELFEDETDI